ncbi:MAG: hypothetical protein GTN99_00310 [Candidatus Dadabacteria bacterium]|nr:hypothetical protein [Candidatus Dadabacteria bacterium]NIT12728.1 hypothetical protein [Candidatus Dadabacteria bacterium]
MNIKMLVFPALSLFFLITLSPYSKSSYIRDNELKIWFLSDIQPRSDKERKDFERTVRDINENITDIDFAVVAGDIVDTTTESSFEWYLETRNNSYIKEWYEIAGNHDLKPDEGLLYREKINNNLYYKVVKNNLLLLFMSDEKRSSASDISDNTFKWWKEIVTKNQDKIIFVITHAPLNGSGITFSSFNRRNIVDSKRFTRVLNKYAVDLWISGHLHIPHSITNNFTTKSNFNGTMFLNISSIRREMLGFKDSESYIITLTCGSNLAQIQSRNHTRGRFNKKQIYNYKLKKKYRCVQEQ